MAVKTHLEAKTMQVEFNMAQINGVVDARDRYLETISEVLREVGYSEMDAGNVDTLFSLGEDIALEGTIFIEDSETESVLEA